MTTASESQTTTLAVAGEAVKTLFKEVTAITNPPGYTGETPWPQHLFAAEARRFEIWARVMGLFGLGHNSLDYRVREAEGLASTLHATMEELNDSLVDVLEYCAGQSGTTNQQHAANVAGDLVTEEFEEGDSGYETPESDLELLVDSLKDPITRLCHLGSLSRGQSRTLISPSALHHQQFDAKFDHDYVNSLFLQYRKSKILKEFPVGEALESAHGDEDADNVPPRTLLSQCNAELSGVTDSQFSYWKSCHDKTVQETRASIQSKEPNETVNPASQGGIVVSQRTLRDYQSTVPISEYAPSMVTADDEIVEFPPPPREQVAEDFFRCPYCFTLCPKTFLRDSAWKAHLIHDLSPYVCTYEDCGTPREVFDTREDWIGHENFHRRAWRCPEHEDQIFVKLDQYREHLSHGHVFSDSNETIDVLITGTQFALPRTDRSCPICFLEMGNTEDLMNHIALHLERFALFSLPGCVDEEDDKAGDVSSQHVNISPNSSRGDVYEQEDERTRLWNAVNRGDCATVKQLLASGLVDPDSRKLNGRTPLWLDAGGWQEDVLRQLLAGGDAPQQSAAVGGNESLVSLLSETENLDQNSRNLRGQTPLLIAAWRGDEAMVRLLLGTEKVDVNFYDIHGETPLSAAAAGGHEAVVRILISDARVNPHLKDKFGWTPMAWAMERRHFEIVMLLLGPARRVKFCKRSHNTHVEVNGICRGEIVNVGPLH
ncbi:hypothetical protein FQN50_000914 [Emmonsiellopsis sp. PD_5]|nr:hypothetical protein FQN50_000914 [Emmonsiellopsis sp. PD_5]